MEKQLSEKIEKALRKLMDEDHYKINAFQLQEWLIDAVKLETHKINLLSKGDVKRSYTLDEVRNIVLELENVALYANSHKQDRQDLRKEIRKVKDRWGTGYNCA